ncbi:SRPBCC family protein [Nakamurella silvestris]|nr:SRPBCC family protein [Nakamurella silvestris]
MDIVERNMACTAADVFRVLDDGWLFGLWVVGASRIRDVHPTWPAEGATIHHSVGTWPLLIDDTTTMLSCVPGESMELRARAWPAGEARVRLSVVDLAHGCRVRMAEDAVRGPATLIPRFARQAALRWRNTEALRRLSYLAEGRPQH